MAESNSENDLSRANFRLCRLCIWPNYVGLGFNLENAASPPHIIRTVESNSPAAAGGLRILDLVLAVNNQDVSNVDYKTVTQAIKNARDNNDRIELLVIEKRFYEPLKSRGTSFDPRFARAIDTPRTMPRDYTNFPKYTPRTCEIRLNKTDQSFGFEVVNGAGDTGAFIQDIVPNSPAGKTTLRKCDRILEIDDKFVDNDLSPTILDKLFKAKKKRAVKLYVVDTNTYKYFRENRIPLTYKDFRKSKFAKQPLVPSSYINVEDIPEESSSADVDIPRPTFPTPLPPLPDTPPIPRLETMSTREVHPDDIRLCTITRANAIDTYGLELNYHRRDQYHSLKVTEGRNTELSNAALAGVKSDDHLIEINGENIENIGDEQVKQRIRGIKYPQPLQILVADTATYNHYKQQKKVIHRGLPTVKKLPENITDRSVSLVLPRPEPGITATSTVTSLHVEEPSSGIAALVNSSLAQSTISMESSQSNRRQYQLQRIQGFAGYGFSVNSNQGGSIAHKITQIAPNSPAAQQGLRVGDYIVTVNNQNVQRMNAVDFNQFLRTSAQNADAHGNPLLLEVINEDFDQPLIIPDDLSTQHSVTDPPSTITSTTGNIIRESSYYRALQRTSSRDGSQKSVTILPTLSRDENRQLTATPPIISRDEVRTLPTTQPTISREGSPKSSRIPPISYRNGSSKLTTTQRTSPQPYQNGYDSPPPPSNRYSRPEIKSSEISSPSLSRSREHLSRGTVDVVSKKRLLRYCRLFIGPGQTFGFQLKPNDDKHIVYNIQPDSPAARAGLSENDCVIEVDDENVENQPSKEVARLIRNAAHNGRLRLFIAPHSVKVLSKRSAKSLSTLNDDRYYRNSPSRSKYADSEPSSTGRYRSVPRLHNEQNNRDPSANNYSSEPTEPLPRKCVLRRDPSFHGCGFRLMEKENYDTPIITEIAPNSPAKRSGLTEGDHIIYINSQNVQNFRSFNDITSLIQRTFEENDQITLVTLTGPGYQVLKKRGGYLENTAFDYQSASIEQLKPRLCRLKLSAQEQDFGFSLQPTPYFSVKSVEQGSPADIYGLHKDDIVLEFNGQIAKDLTINQIKQITELSKQERKLDLLVIDMDGYRYSMKHAIPLNSLLSFVQTKEGQMTTTNHRVPQEPVYL